MSIRLEAIERQWNSIDRSDPRRFNQFLLAAPYLLTDPGSQYMHQIGVAPGKVYYQGGLTLPTISGLDNQGHERPASLGRFLEAFQQHWQLEQRGLNLDNMAVHELAYYAEHHPIIATADFYAAYGSKSSNKLNNRFDHINSRYERLLPINPPQQIEILTPGQVYDTHNTLFNLAYRALLTASVATREGAFVQDIIDIGDRSKYAACRGSITTVGTKANTEAMIALGLLDREQLPQFFKNLFDLHLQLSGIDTSTLLAKGGNVVFNPSVYIPIPSIESTIEKEHLPHPEALPFILDNVRTYFSRMDNFVPPGTILTPDAFFKSAEQAIERCKIMLRLYNNPRDIADLIELIAELNNHIETFQTIDKRNQRQPLILKERGPFAEEDNDAQTQAFRKVALDMLNEVLGWEGLTLRPKQEEE